GGKTWVTQGESLKMTEWMHGVDFVSDQEGIAVGEYGTILHTIDGGKTWKVDATGKQQGSTRYTLNDVSFPKPKTAFVAAEWGLILKYKP
ncbi:hypothetical protein FJZ33_11005, partial [Candidatus Poribacteria bacterium]|nr:hypothetical protein [Candidatus Poribacteria bacterium]